ncbi:MAG TPA: hypothetical protein ENN60_02200 [archaeon]|nr:hypothetical protein [archaeon]
MSVSDIIERFSKDKNWSATKNTVLKDGAHFHVLENPTMKGYFELTVAPDGTTKVEGHSDEVVANIVRMSESPSFKRKFKKSYTGPVAPRIGFKFWTESEILNNVLTPERNAYSMVIGYSFMYKDTAFSVSVLNNYRAVAFAKAGFNGELEPDGLKGATHALFKYPDEFLVLMSSRSAKFNGADAGSNLVDVFIMEPRDEEYKKVENYLEAHGGWHYTGLLVNGTYLLPETKPGIPKATRNAVV